MQFLQPQAKALSQYIQQINKPLSQIILSHAHPDHWFGYPHFAVTATTTENVKAHLDERGQEYIDMLSKKLDELPSKPITVAANLQLGKQNWDGLNVIVEEYINQESLASVVVKIPQYGIIIGQDLFYNDAHLVAPNLERNQNWIAILEDFKANEAKNYHTFLVGHGANTDSSVLQENIDYLKVLHKIVSEGASKTEAKQLLIEAFPDKAQSTQGFIDITLRNLYSEQH